MIKSKRRINKRELIESSRRLDVPALWRSSDWFKTLESVYGTAQALAMGLDARKSRTFSGDGCNASVWSVVVWDDTRHSEAWSNARYS